MSEILFFIGTFTDGTPYFQGAQGDGIVTCALDTNTGLLERRHTYRDILNPDYIAYDAKRRMLFSIADNLTAAGKVVAFQVADSGKLQLLSHESSRAPVSCHICIGAEEVYTASYMESCLTAHAITTAGVGELRQEFRYSGTGPNAARQEASHAHQAAITPDGRQLFVCDLGSDKIWIHQIKQGRIAPDAPTFFPMPPGCGPRQLEFHPTLPVAYVLGELNAHTMVLDYRTGQILADLSGHFPGAPTAAAIHLHPGGTMLSTSNRSDNSIAQYRVDAAGRLTWVGRFDSGGKCPRDFNIDPTGRWLVAAGQDSHSLTVHELDPVTGAHRRQASGSLPVNTPVCVVFGGC
ncbi:MAG: 6-phosphogluconolactonase [Verrucomicrobiae bacterium]|nr:6-phosphogluconolactonase [Verrucomicrobiae bacterium]